MWCCVTPERDEKTRRIMEALAEGTGGTVQLGAPPNTNRHVFAVWGQKWLAADIIPKAVEEGVPFWQIDNGFYKSAKGLERGYYSLSYRSLSPILLPDPDYNRLPIEMFPWTQRTKGYILLAMPGMSYGEMFGLNMPKWAGDIHHRISKHTSRKINVRYKHSSRRLVNDLNGAFVVVTHSSKVAIDAVISGVPAIVEPTNPAAPVCGLNLNQIENPPVPARDHWWASLMCQQFTIDEMRKGVCKPWMDKIEALYGK